VQLIDCDNIATTRLRQRRHRRNPGHHAHRRSTHRRHHGRAQLAPPRSLCRLVNARSRLPTACRGCGNRRLTWPADLPPGRVMPRSDERVTVIAGTTQGGGNGHGRGRQQPVASGNDSAGAGAVAHRSAAAGSQRPRARGSSSRGSTSARKRRWSSTLIRVKRSSMSWRGRWSIRSRASRRRRTALVRP